MSISSSLSSSSSRSRSRSRPAESPSGEKILPPLPLGGLQLDFSGDTRAAGVGHGSTGSMRSHPLPSHYIPLHPSSPLESPSSPSSLSSPAVSTPTTSIASPAFPFQYGINSNHSSSTVTDLAGRSTANLTIPPHASTAMTTVISAGSGPSTPTKPKSTKSVNSSSTPTSMNSRRVAFGMSPSTTSVVSATELNSSTSSRTSNGGRFPVSLSKKRSSGQLLFGLVKGLNRVGSVMRRNTADDAPTPSKASPIPSGSEAIRRRDGDGHGTWRRGRKWKTQTVMEGMTEDEGDTGVGRPFNVAHDLHVSPDLADLPSAWLDILLAQGLTEADLLTISAARKRQHGASRTPPGNPGPGLYKAPFSAPFDGGGGLTVPRPGNLLRKFSFEPESPTTPIATKADPPLSKNMKRSPRTSLLDAFDSAYISAEALTSSPKPSRDHGGARTTEEPESYPVSAAESSDLSGAETETDESFSPSPSFRGGKVRVTPASQNTHDSHHQEADQHSEEMLVTPTRARTTQTKRLSDQLRGFREHTFGLGEGYDDWGSSILGAGWAAATMTASRTASSSPDGAKNSSPKRIGQPPHFSAPPPPLQEQDEPHTPDRRNSSLPTGPQTTDDPAREDYTPRSPPPPPRSRPHQRGLSAPLTVNHDQDSEHEYMVIRKSSESFGVHYNRSKSSVELALITPSTSAEHTGTRGTTESDEERYLACSSGRRDSQPDEEVDGDMVSMENEVFDLLTRKASMSKSRSPLPTYIDKPTGKINSYEVGELRPSPLISNPHSPSTDGNEPLQPTPASTPFWLTRPYPDPRRPDSHTHSHFSIPASAVADSVIPSRAASPASESEEGGDYMARAPLHLTSLSYDDTSLHPHPFLLPADEIRGQGVIARTADYDGDHRHRATNDEHMPTNHGAASIVINTTAGTDAEHDDMSSLSLQETDSDPDPLANLDQAGRDERASIALSILSSRTSSDMHDLHEVGEATVRIAYKGHAPRPLKVLAPAYEVGRECEREREGGPGPGPKTFRPGPEESRTYMHDTTLRKGGETSTSTCAGALSPMDHSVCLSEESEGYTGVEAKAALDALGEAARRAFRSHT